MLSRWGLPAWARIPQVSLAQPPAALQPCVRGHAGELPALRTTACLQLRPANNELVTGSWQSWGGGNLSLRSSATSLVLVPDGSSLDTLAERLRQLAVIGGGQSGNLSVHSFARSVVVVPDSSSLDTLAERLRRRPAKPMGSPCVGSNPTGVVVAFVRSLRRRVAGQRTAVRVSARVALW